MGIIIRYKIIGVFRIIIPAVPSVNFAIIGTNETPGFISQFALVIGSGTRLTKQAVKRGEKGVKKALPRVQLSPISTT